MPGALKPPLVGIPLAPPAGTPSSRRLSWATEGPRSETSWPAPMAGAKPSSQKPESRMPTVTGFVDRNSRNASIRCQAAAAR